MLRLTNRCNPTQNKITVTDFEVIPQNKIIGNGPLFIAQKPKGKDVYYVEGFNDNGQLHRDLNNVKQHTYSELERLEKMIV